MKIIFEFSICELQRLQKILTENEVTCRDNEAELEEAYERTRGVDISPAREAAWEAWQELRLDWGLCTNLRVQISASNDD